MKADLLAKASERMDAEKKLAECTHPHLKFGRSGFELSCIDCKRRWVTTMTGYDIPDFTYMNAKFGVNDFRHSPHESPRTEPSKQPAPTATKRKR